MYYKVVLKNFKNGIVIRKNIMYYNDTEENIILKCVNGETKIYQKNEWALIRTDIVRDIKMEVSK